MTDKLPPNWLKVRLGDVCTAVSQRGPDKSRATFKYIDLGAIDNKLKRISVASEVPTSSAPSRAKQIVRAGDVVFSTVRVYLENIAEIPSDLESEIASTAFCVLRPVEGVSSRFLYHYVTSRRFVLDVNRLQRGNSPPSVQDGDIRSQELPLPPTGEQKRIASRIDELFSRIDEGERALERVQKLMERYRQSVLKAAVTGELTRDWREKNKDKLESGEAVLARILKARRAAWEKAELDKMKAKGITPANDKWKQKYEEPAGPDTAGLPELPSGWTWASIDQVSAHTLIGLDRGSAEQSSDSHGCPYVKMNNVTTNGEVLFDDIVFVAANPAEREKFVLRDGDILFNTRNSKELVGKCGLVDSPPPSSLYNNNLMRIRTVSEVDPRYLINEMCAPGFRERMELVKKATTNVAAVYAKDLFPLAVAVPPMKEQRAIMSEVARLMSISDQLENELSSRLNGAKALRQSLLHSAFTGKLVAQLEDDEPAQILLRNIATERDEVPAKPKRGRKPKTSEPV